MPPSSATLRRAPAFAALPDGAVEALALCCRERRFVTGERVFSEGEPASSLLLVAEGELIVSSRAYGSSRPFARVGPGQLLGEAALCDRSPRVATVVAACPALVLEIDADAVDALRRAAPAAGRALLGAAIAGVARRLRQIDQRIEHELERGGTLP
jgi:CRP-like cAMP-binding protein